MFNNEYEENYKKIAVDGLLKLAIGKVNDIMKIMFFADEATLEDFNKINFMSVSEIKRDKDGGVQVKFFDKQTALETLYKIADENTSSEKAENFLKEIVN